MSDDRSIQIPPPEHVKFTKSGCAYVEMDDLIDSVFEQFGIVVPPPPTNQPKDPDNLKQDNLSQNH